MIKFVAFCTKVIAATTAAALFASCQIRDIQIGNGIDGNGNVTTEKRSVEGNFTKVDVSSGLNVTLEQGNSYNIEVEADQNLQEHITVKVENGTLFISTDENIDEATTKTIHVKMPSMTSLETTSGSSVSTMTTFSGSNFEVKTSSGSEVNLSLEIDTITCKSSSGSTLTVSGKALQLKTHSSSGSSIDTQGLLVNDVVSEASSGSSTNVHPIVSLKAKASSGSSVNYQGAPKTVSKEESSGGSVSKE